MDTIVITGGAGAIGEAIASAFAVNYNVVITYLNSEEKALDMQKNMGISAIKTDVTDRKQVKYLAEYVNNKFGGADILINNAGISQIKLFTDITQADWNDMVNVHLTGTFNVTQEILPQMLNKRTGSIINISSVWGRVGASCEVHYSTVKAGIIGFTKALAKEVGLSGITVNCIAPGVIQSKMNNELTDNDIEYLKEQTPMNAIGTPEDVADLALYLAGARFVTGQIIGVDGGFNIS